MARLSKEHKKTLKSFIAPDYTGPAQQKTEPGLKYDAGKVPIHLFAPEMLFGTCFILDFGAKKYAERNWERGMSWSRCFGAMMRHMWAWWAGKSPTKYNFLFGDLDAETGFSHLWHASCCLMFLIAYEQRPGMDEFDDRPVHKDLFKPSGKKFSWRKK